MIMVFLHCNIFNTLLETFFLNLAICDNPRAHEDGQVILIINVTRATFYCRLVESFVNQDMFFCTANVQKRV